MVSPCLEYRYGHLHAKTEITRGAIARQKWRRPLFQVSRTELLSLVKWALAIGIRDKASLYKYHRNLVSKTNPAVIFSCKKERSEEKTIRAKRTEAKTKKRMGTAINSHFLALTVFVTVGYQFISAITVLHKFDKDNDHAGEGDEKIPPAEMYSYYLSGLTGAVIACYHFFYSIIPSVFHFDELIELAGITNFVILAISALVLKGSKNFRQLVLPLLVLVWGLRLGLFLVIRIMQWGQDRRFDGRRGSLCRLVIIAMLQVIWVWTLSLPVTFVIASDRHPSLQAKDIIGWTIWSVGFLIEAIADQQKLAFKFPPENRERWCSTGLWRYSRHPNYFGEILLWWGVFVASSPLLEGGTWIVIVGPILHTMLILFASGMPWLEESANTRYGHINPYRAYRDATSPLIPLPPVVYLHLPRWFKIAFLFELPLYSVTLPSPQALELAGLQ